MKWSIHNQIVLSRVPEGPLAIYIEPLARSLLEQGYAKGSIYRHILLAASFSQWLKQQGIALRNLSSVHPPRYL